MVDTTNTATPAETFVRHTCNPRNPGKPLPFGRKAAPGECPRCDELLAGAPPREAHPAIQAAVTRRTEDAQRTAEIRVHFASETHRSGACGTVCTFGEW